MLRASKAPIEPSFSAVPNRPSTGAIVSTSRSGSSVVRTRNRSLLFSEKPIKNMADGK